MLSEKDKSLYLPRVLNPNLGYLNRKALRKQILDKVKKVSVCPYCKELNGIVKKAGLLKIVHEKYRSKKKTDPIIQEKLAEFNDVVKHNKELENTIQSGLITVLTPLEVN